MTQHVQDPNESAVTHLAHALARKEVENAMLKAELARTGNELKRRTEKVAELEAALSALQIDRPKDDSPA